MNISVVFIKMNPIIYPPPPAIKNFSGIPLVSIEITHGMVMDKLNALNPGKSTGLDRLHP